MKKSIAILMIVTAILSLSIGAGSASQVDNLTIAGIVTSGGVTVGRFPGEPGGARPPRP